MKKKIIRIGTSAGITVSPKQLEELGLSIGDEVKVKLEALHPKTGRGYASITAHGRFQPPVHVNHWDYLQEAFKLSDHVRLLITNPYPHDAPEAHVDSAAWRSLASSNPFSYEERVYMFEEFFKRIGIDHDRYSIEPFDITNIESFKVLETGTPNLVNVYSEWSASKAEKFRSQGLTVMQLDQPKLVDVSGMQIREIIKCHEGDLQTLGSKLIEAGFMPEAVPGLLGVLQRRLS